MFQGHLRANRQGLLARYMHGPPQFFCRQNAKDAVLCLILLAFVLLASAWSWIVPIYEAPDEPDHTQFVDYFSTHTSLPDSRTDIAAAGVESTQGPLYYFLGGLLLRIVGAPGFYVKPIDNPGFSFDFDSPEHHRYVEHTSGHELIIHFARMLSIVGGVITVAATFGLARVLTAQNDIAMLAASFVAFLPQFTFISSVVSNDSFAAAAGAVVLLLAIWMSTTSVVKPWHYALLGFATGLAVLTKASLLSLVPIGSLVLIYHARSCRPALVRSGMVYLLSFVLGGGWFFLRNIYLYGGPIDSAARTMIGVSQTYPFNMLGDYFIHRFPKMVSISFVGVFGWMNILLPNTVYVLFETIVFLSFVSVWRVAWRQRSALPLPWLILICAVILNGISLVAWNFGYYADQGRLMFPVLAGIAVLLARGWAVSPQPFRSVLFMVIGLGLFALNVFSLYVVWAAYR